MPEIDNLELDSRVLLSILVFASALAVALVVTPVARRLGLRLGLVDLPGGRRQHRGRISRIGGVGLGAAFFLTALGLFAAGVARAEYNVPLIGVLAGTAFVFLGGLADDRFHLKAVPQFAIQFGAAAIAIAFTVWIEVVTLPFVEGPPRPFPWYITYPLTIAWVVGMMNTVNFLDGLDGLAAGVGAIAAALFAVHLMTPQWNNYELAAYALALCGACVGFLVFNFNPAKVFLGSAGAMTLGYALATLSILAPARVMTAALIMLVPIIDTAFLVFDRWRRGRSPFQGDRAHLHFRLMSLGLSQRQIVLGYWAFCAVFGTLVVYLPRVYKLLTLGVLGVIVIGVMLALSQREEKEKERKLERETHLGDGQ
jgi:UDP-GlcNAc:undecaprenyl-phosphate GlcNAc-1-phosphate transferase